MSNVEKTVGLKDHAIKGILLPVVFACSLISPGMCVQGVTPYLASRTGWAMAIAILIAGLLNFFWATSYTDMCRLFPKCGCHYTYIRNGLGPKIGFFVGAGVLPVYIFACGAHVIVFTETLHSIFPAIPTWVVYIGYPVFITLLSIRGISLTSFVSAGMFLCEASILLALSFTCIGVTWPKFTVMAPHFFVPENPFTWGTVMFASVLCVYNFIGFAAETSLVEESTPDDISRSINWSLVITLIIYVLALIALPLACNNYGENANSTTPMVDTARMFWGNFWPVVVIGVLLSTCTCSLACINTGSRMMYDMARDGALPAWFTKIHQKYRTPWAALAFSGVFYFVSAALIPYVIQVELIVIVMLLTYAAVALSNLMVKRPILSWWAFTKSRVMPVIGLVMAVYLMTTASKTAWTWSLVWFAIVLAYEIYISKARPHALQNLNLTEM